MKRISPCISVLIFLLSIGSLAGAAKGGDDFSPDPAVLAAFDELQEYITNLPDDVLKKGQKVSLIKKLTNSEKAYKRGQPCTAANILQAFLNETQALHRGKRLEIAEDLYNRGWALLYDLLAGLTAEQECSRFPGFGDEPATDVVESDNKLLKAVIKLGKPRMLTVKPGDELFTEMTFKGLETGEAFGGPGAAGKPAVQMLYKLVAVPIGAKPILRILESSSYKVLGVNLYPHQPSAVDPGDEEMPPSETFEDPPFTKDEEAYQQDAYYPPDLVSMHVVGQMRDMNLVQISIASAQYNPVEQALIVTEKVGFEVQYEGGTGNFLTGKSATPFEAFNIRPLLEEAVMNAKTAYEYVHLGPFVWIHFGEELLIITDPAFVNAANDLKDWKNAKGIVTKVFKTGAAIDGGIGTTREEIRDFIQYRYDHNLVRPSYVLLLGDAEFIAPFYRWSSGSATTGTDLDYSLMTGGDLIADIGVARIPVDTLAQAQTVVDKIINYEKYPPSATGFYDNAAIPAYFQCCRTGLAATQDGTTSRGYIETMELIRAVLVADGYDVDRLYLSDTTYHGGYTGNTTPRRYRDGTLLPAAIGGTSGFVWNADTQDIIDAFDDGRFLVIHRNHGGKSGWGSPEFRTADVSTLANGNLLPVLFSVDCATGLFDNETAAGDYVTTVGGVYFLESLLRDDDGVVGALGDTRNSPTWANNALTRGFADAVFPDVLPAYGTTTSIRRLADILNYGKIYLDTQVGIEPTGTVTQTNADSNNVMWHAFGDPTQEIWTSRPFILSRIYATELFLETVVVSYSVDDAVITATQGGVPIGRARVFNGQASLEFVVEPNPDLPIEYSASKQNHVSVRLPNCYPDLPSPELVFTGSEDYVVDGNDFTRYDLEVINSGDFPDELFEAAPHLPPCGLNANSSRTWVHIYDNLGNRLYGFCGLNSSDGLKNLWFAVPKGTTPPDSVYIEIVDREPLCDTTYRSNLASICYPDAPSPTLVYTGSENYFVAGTEFTRYDLEVTNSGDFPEEFFDAAPHLPPCGSNTNSSRAWVHIYDTLGNRLYGFCALDSTDGLKNLWFALPVGTVPPDAVYIEIVDRERGCNNTYTSNHAPICYPNLPDPTLDYTGSEDFTGSGGELRTRYFLEVTNTGDYPNQLFVSAPYLPACGLNPNSSRTWVDIFDNNDVRLYGFCALNSPDGMKNLWFSGPQGTPPQAVYIEMDDRLCEDTFISNLASIGP